MNTPTPELYADINEIENFKVIARFKNRINKDRTWTPYKYHLRTFFRYLHTNGGEFMGMDPDELVAYVKKMPDKYDFTDALLDYKSNQENKGLRVKTVKSRITIIRSLFNHNRVQLPKETLLWKVNAKTPIVEGTLDTKEIMQMILSFNPTYQAVFTSMFQSGMDSDCFMRWNESGWDALKEALRRDDRVHEIAINGRKHTKNKLVFYTFIGKDALDKIRTYLPYRPEGATHIFYTKQGKPITKNSVYLMWMRHLKTQGMIVLQDNGTASRYGKNPHEIRDVFVTQFQKSPAGKDAGNYFTGHVGDSNGYAKAFKDPTHRRKMYRLGEPYISIFSNNKAFGTVSEEEYLDRVDQLESLQTQIDRLVTTQQRLLKERGDWEVLRNPQA